MFTLLILIVVFVSFILRLITASFRFGYRRRSPFYGSYNPYLYGCRRRHHRLVGTVFPIFALVALDWLFRRRY